MTEKLPLTSNLLGWNINGGGYDRRHVFDNEMIIPEAAAPEREASIKAIIDHQHMTGIDSVALIDTYGWEQRYGSDANIAQHLGFRAARFAPLLDDRIDRILGPGAGLAFATDHPIEQSSPLDLDTRQGLGTIINVDGRVLQVATVYLDDMNEQTRLNQLAALLAQLEPEPTVIIGDLNSLRPNMRGSAPRTRAHDMGFRALTFSAALIPSKAALDPLFRLIGHSRLATKADYYKQAIRGLNQRKVVPALEQGGWQDADPKKQPTFRKLGGFALNVDYVFSNYRAMTSNFEVIPAKHASDHDAIRVQVSVKE